MPLFAIAIDPAIDALLGCADSSRRLGLAQAFFEHQPDGFETSLLQRHKVSFHAFRRTAILNLRAAGIEEGTAMAISGHRTRAVFDRYGIQPEAKLHEAMKKLETEIRTKDG